MRSGSCVKDVQFVEFNDPVCRKKILQPVILQSGHNSPLAVSLHKIWLLNHREKGSLADCSPSLSTNKLHGVFQKFPLERIVGLSN